jgi:hypothetical protein
MDPDETLKNMLDRARAILANEGFFSDLEIEMAENMIDLHNWISRGGDIPQEWNRQ